MEKAYAIVRDVAISDQLPLSEEVLSTLPIFLDEGEALDFLDYAKEELPDANYRVVARQIGGHPHCENCACNLT